MRADCPQVSDVEKVLTSLGVDFSSIDIDAERLGAIAQWGLDVGYPVFKVESADSTRYFSPHECYGQGILSLKCGYVSITSVTVGLTATDTTGTVLTVNQDYWLEPLGGDGPYHYLRFWSLPAGEIRSIKVIGKRGYSTDGIPDDVWLAVCKKAAAMAISNTLMGVTSSITQGPVSIGTGGSGGGITSALENEYKTVVGSGRYVRPSFGSA
jgi:hypothetical protein